MRSRRHRNASRRLPVAAVAILVLLMGTVLRADDHEGPIIPDGASSGQPEFGEIVVDSTDLGGSSVDAKEALEPQLTALLAAGEVDGSASDSLYVTTQPVLDIWEQ